MMSVRSVVLAVLLGCIVTSAAMSKTVLFRGEGRVYKFTTGNNGPMGVKFVATVVIDYSDGNAVRFGYKAEFSDGSEEKLALLLSDEDKAKLLVHSGTRQRADGFAGASGTFWTEDDNDNRVFRVEFTRKDFTRENGSKMQIAVKEQSVPSAMGELVPDIKLAIIVKDLPSPENSDRTAYKWKFSSQLDFNALIRVEDASAEALEEELFGN